MAAAGRLALLAGGGRGPAHERAMEAHRHSVLREGVGQDRLGPGDAAAHRDRPALVRRAVPHAADGCARRCAAHRLSWRRYLAIRAIGRAVSADGAADHRTARVVRTVAAGAAAPIAAAVTHEAIAELIASRVLI